MRLLGRLMSGLQAYICSSTDRGKLTSLSRSDHSLRSGNEAMRSPVEMTSAKRLLTNVLLTVSYCNLALHRSHDVIRGLRAYFETPLSLFFFAVCNTVR